MRILNLYAGIGGNRKLWPNEHEITAVEIDSQIAGIYAKYYPNDKVVIGDAHQYLLEHYKEFDFIWSSPPCPTHSRINNFAIPQGRVRYPAMELWQEVIFLKHFCKVPYCVENVISYYKPLIFPQESGRHYFWANFKIPNIEEEIQCGRFGKTKKGRTDRAAIERISSTSSVYGFNLQGEHIGGRKDQILRNCVNPRLGLAIFEAAFKKKQLLLTDEGKGALEKTMLAKLHGLASPDAPPNSSD